MDLIRMHEGLGECYHPSAEILESEYYFRRTIVTAHRSSSLLGVIGKLALGNEVWLSTALLMTVFPLRPVRSCEGNSAP